MALIIAVYREVDEVERAVPRPRIYRDRENPLDFYPDHEIYQRFRFDRAGILFITDLLAEDIEPPTNRSHVVPALLQVFIILRFYACGSFQQVVADTIRIHQSNTC